MIRPASETLSEPDRELTLELIGLVHRAIASEPTAQRELVDRYARRVAGFVRPLIRQPDAVEDVVQMVFIKMFRRLDGLRDAALFEAWLFTLARNTALDFIRRRSRRPLTVGFDPAFADVPDLRNDSATAEIMEALDRALTRLAPIDQLLVRRFVAGDDFSIGDIPVGALAYRWLAMEHIERPPFTALVAWQARPAWPLLVAANRDEFHSRPAAVPTSSRASLARSSPKLGVNP